MEQWAYGLYVRALQWHTQPWSLAGEKYSDWWESRLRLYAHVEHDLNTPRAQNQG